MKKILWIIVILAFILWGAFYSWILSWLGEKVSYVNTNFWAFLPIEIRIFLSLIIFVFVVILAYAFID